MSWWIESARALEHRVAAASLRRRRERPALLSFLLHGLFESGQEAHGGAVRPFQPFLVDDLRRLVEHFLEHGYRFVSPREILGGLDHQERHVFLTFDDGYANNLRALPTMREFGVPATFFVSTAPVARGTAFWWDVLYRERRRRGTSERAIANERRVLARRPHEAIDAYVVKEFGSHALTPLGEADRPMTDAELKMLASEPLATVGNHTVDHAILTRYSDAGVMAQVQGSQDYLRSLTGVAPEVIAYPSGAVTRRVVRIARDQGLRLGVIVRPAKNRLPLSSGQEMTIARYFIRGGATLLDDCRVCRADLQIMSGPRRLLAVLS